MNLMPLTLTLGLLDVDAALGPALHQALSSLEAGLPGSARLETLQEARSPERHALLIWWAEDIDPTEAVACAERALTVRSMSSWSKQVTWLNFAGWLELGLARGVSPLANLIIREIEPAGLEEFLDPLQAQMVRVAARPGCLGIFLGQQLDRSNALLGITRWDSMASLEVYLQWAGAQEFKSVVDPLTRAAPLRFLGQPLS
jgi:quinol monooxygenase YgiN